MIQSFVDSFMERKDDIRRELADIEEPSYKDIVRTIVGNVQPGNSWWDRPDPERIHVIDDGGYQGVLVFVIGQEGYAPERYWTTKVAYGSCSGCDTLYAIRNEASYDAPTEEQLDDYMMLALHLVQNFQEV